MRIGVLFFFLLILSVGVTIASSVSAEIPFLIVFALHFYLRPRALFLATLATGVFLDIYSPVKGLSLLSYCAGIGMCSLLSRLVLTNRSAFAFFTLGSASWLTVILVKWGLFIGITSIADIHSLILLFSHTQFFAFGQSVGILCLMLIALYPLVSECSGPEYTQPFRKI